jgi:hypothetical protein
LSGKPKEQKLLGRVKNRSILTFQSNVLHFQDWSYAERASKHSANKAQSVSCCLTYFPVLMKMAAHSSEEVVNFYEATQHHVQEDNINIIIMI